MQQIIEPEEVVDSKAIEEGGTFGEIIDMQGKDESNDRTANTMDEFKIDTTDMTAIG